MPTRDGIEIRATLKSLAMLLKQVILGHQEPTSNYMTWFLIKLNGLLPFAGDTTTTAEKLQQIITEIKQAQQKLHDEATHDEFYPFVRNALQFMDEVMNTSTSGPLENIASDALPGKHVVYFDAIVTPQISVGRAEKVHQASLGETVASGFIAEVTLQEADDQQKMAALFYQTYLYANPKPPAPEVFYAWPADLPPQTFKNPRQPDHSITITLKTSLQIIIVSSADFEDRE
jgi:hypothetical protein